MFRIDGINEVHAPIAELEQARDSATS